MCVDLGLLLGSCKPVADVVPADHVPNGLHVVRSHVLVLEIIGMLPHINAQEGYKTCAGERGGWES